MTLPLAGFALTLPASAEAAVPDTNTVIAIIVSHDDNMDVDLRISPPYFLKFFNLIFP
jgi:hypothetical protein